MTGQCLRLRLYFAYLKNHNIRSKKVVLFPQIGRVKKILSVTGPHSRMCIRIYIFNFKSQTNKQKKKKNKNTKKVEETKEKRVPPENRLKK